MATRQRKKKYIKGLTQHFQKTMPEREILIVTNDYDYLQLLDDKIHIYNLKNKNLREKSLGSRKLDLGVKIIVGDNSDNIPKCFPKCGQKTAIKYLENPDLLDKAFAKYPESKTNLCSLFGKTFFSSTQSQYLGTLTIPWLS